LKNGLRSVVGVSILVEIVIYWNHAM